MSLINRMLQDLDRRQALGTAEAGVAPVAAPSKPANREWFWRLLVVLLAAALVWLGWVAVQLMPRRPLATDLAYLAAAEAKQRAKQAPAPGAQVPTPVVQAPAAPALESTPIRGPESLRLATELNSPVAPRAQPVAAPQPKVVVNSPAEAHFGRAVLLLADRRVDEAEEQLQAAIKADAKHAAARQAYVSLLLDQQRNAAARRLLVDTLVVDPTQAQFALALARIHASERDYLSALAVLERAGTSGQDADFQAFRAAMLQRLGRHEDALEVYENAVRMTAPAATTWIGYGISLEAVGRRADAAQAYRRALAVASIPPEAREFAASRARALD